MTSGGLRAIVLLQAVTAGILAGAKDSVPPSRCTPRRDRCERDDIDAVLRRARERRGKPAFDPELRS